MTVPDPIVKPTGEDGFRERALGDKAKLQQAMLDAQLAYANALDLPRDRARVKRKRLPNAHPGVSQDVWRRALATPLPKNEKDPDGFIWKDADGQLHVDNTALIKRKLQKRYMALRNMRERKQLQSVSLVFG